MVRSSNTKAMLTTEEKLIDWCSRRGIRLRPDQAEYLVNMVRNDMKYGWWTVEKFKYDYQKNGYIPYYSELVPPAKASKIIETPVKEVKQFNLFRITKPDGTTYEIYTVRDDLFRLT